MNKPSREVNKRSLDDITIENERLLSMIEYLSQNTLMLHRLIKEEKDKRIKYKKHLVDIKIKLIDTENTLTEIKNKCLDLHLDCRCKYKQ